MSVGNKNICVGKHPVIMLVSTMRVIKTLSCVLGSSSHNYWLRFFIFFFYLEIMFASYVHVSACRRKDLLNSN